MTRYVDGDPVAAVDLVLARLEDNQRQVDEVFTGRGERGHVVSADPEIIEPIRKGETLMPERARAVLLAAAQLLLSGRSHVEGGFVAPVSSWFTRLSGEVGEVGTGISDEMLGGLALANVVLRSRDRDQS